MRGFTLLFFLVACADDGGKDVVGNTDDTGPGGDDSTPIDDSSEPACAAAVVSTSPADGSVDVAIDVQPTVVISELDSTTALSSDIPGTYIAMDDGLTYVWVADGPLENDTTYTVTATTCTGSTSFSFTTLAAATPDHLVDRTWGVDLAGGTITEPAVMESLVGDSLSPGLIGITAVGPGSVDLRVAAVATGVSPPQQDYCLTTSDVPGASYVDGLVTGYSDELWVALVPGDPVPVYGLEFQAQWSEEGEGFTEGSMEGDLDARYICEWLSMDADELCALASAFGFPCAECPDGELYCVHMRMENLNGLEVDTTLMSVSANNCPGCESGEPVCE